MSTVSALLSVIGAFGAIGMGPLFPLLARALWPRKVNQPSSQLPSLEILVPAHQEAGTIAATLGSLRTASNAPIHVGVDACTDATASLARKMGARVSDFSYRSKWQNLRSLVQSSEAEWVALVDCGTIWPTNFAERVLALASPDVMAIAPAYRAQGGGFAERLHWFVERWLKKQEGFSAGPVSVHGATVFYRRDVLQKAFGFLGETKWLNDDVALPTALHIVSPKQRILYLADLCVTDQGLAAEGARRMRLMSGNLDWLRFLLPKLNNAPAFCVAQRRVFRIFWAYWLLFLAGGFLSQPLLLIAAVPLLAFPRAALASLSAPFWLCRARQEAAWK